MLKSEVDAVALSLRIPFSAIQTMPASHCASSCLRNAICSAVLDLPGGAFIGTGVKTVVLFFEKGKPTEKVWYYQLNVGRNMGKTNPLNEKDLAEFVEMAKTQS